MFDTNQIKFFENEQIIINQMNLPEEIEALKEKLNSSFQYRQFKIKNNNMNIFTDCNYIFICPELVSNFYTLLKSK